jgi:hypothetical protein
MWAARFLRVVIVEGAKTIVPWVPRSSESAPSESRTVSSDGRARPGAVGGEAGGHPGREHERGVNLLQGAQPALRPPYRPPHGGLEQFARHRLIQLTGLVRPTRQHLSETPAHRTRPAHRRQYGRPDPASQLAHMCRHVRLSGEPSESLYQGPELPALIVAANRYPFSNSNTAP